MTKIGQGLVVLGLALWWGTRKSGEPTVGPSSGASSTSTSAAAAPSQVPLTKPEQVSAARVAAEFANNEAATEDRYENRCLVLTGTVTSIDAGIGKEPTLSLAGAGSIMGVLVSDVPREFAKTLNRGDSVILDVEGLGEVLSQPVARYSSPCQSKRLAFEAQAAATKPSAPKAKAKPAASQAKN